MRNRNLLVAALLSVFTSGSLFAQSPETPPEQPRPARSMRVRGLDKIDPRHMTEELTTTVGLDESQKSQVQQILTTHQQKLSELRKQFAPPQGTTEQFTRIREELKVAREAKDQAKQVELMNQLTNIRKEEEVRRAPMLQAQGEAREALKGNLSAIMRPDQKQKFDTYWTEKMEASRDRYDGPARSPQVLKALTDRLSGVSSEQKTQLDTLYKAYFDAAKQNKEGATANDALVKKLYDDVLNVLTPEQRVQIEAKIKGNQRTRNSRPAQSPPEQKTEPKQTGG